LGVISYATDNYNDAIYYFSEAIDNNPTVEESYVNRHFTYLVQNNVASAIEDINKAIIISPSYPEYYLYREKLHLMSNNKEKAMKDFYKADEIYAKDFHRDKIEYNALSKQSLYEYILSLRNKK